MRHSHIDQFSNNGSLLSQIDPRIKIIAFVFFVVFIALTPADRLFSLCLYLLPILVFTIIGRIPLKYIIIRAASVIPFAILIGFFNLFSKPAGEGVLFLWSCLSKAVLSVIAMFILISSTKFPDLLKALEYLKIPGIITMVISFMYRYIFVGEDELLKMMRAKESRSVNNSLRSNIAVLPNIIGTLFIRSYERAEAVYVSMCSRGFNEKIKTLDTFKVSAKDIFFLFITIAFLVLTAFIRR